MNNSVFDVIVVGAGHAGLSASYYLKRLGFNHLVFERGTIGESWKSQRWDSFKLNTANKLNLLSGINYDGNEPDGFGTAAEFVSLLNAYAANLQLPVLENTDVVSVEKHRDPNVFRIVANHKNVLKTYYCRQVIIASGAQNEKKVPLIANQISSDIKQFHSSEYRNSARLPAGAVLVAGSAQSGCQVAEDLLGAGKKVYLSTSMVPRIPRKYHGKDIMDWFIQMKFFDMTAGQISDPRMMQMKAPQLTGTGDGRQTISLQKLAQKGAIILGKLGSTDGQNVFFEGNAAGHIQFADEFSKNTKDMIDGFIKAMQLSAPAPEEDVNDIPDINNSSASSTTSLNLKEFNITTIVWATGLNANFNYIKLPVFGNDGSIKHQNGISGVQGLYFLGLPWMRSRKSSLIYGIKEDAAFICEKVYEYSQRNVRGVPQVSLS